MTNYIIKKTAIATEDNKLYPCGYRDTCYIGKSGSEADYPSWLVSDYDSWERKAYAVKKAAEYNARAKESFKKYPFWNVEYAVIVIDD